jgi:hypothetical protein
LSTDVEDGEDVRVIERARGLRFACESPQPPLVGGKRGRQHLHGDVAVEARISSAVDLAHAAGPDRSGDGVRPETGTSRERHQCVR